MTILVQQLRAEIEQLQAEIKRLASHGNEPGTVRVTADWLKTVHRDLDACQKVIWLAGCGPRGYGFDPAYCEGAQARLKEIDEHIGRAQAMTKEQP